jgi:hypothetical protein
LPLWFRIHQTSKTRVLHALETSASDHPLTTFYSIRKESSVAKSHSVTNISNRPDTLQTDMLEVSVSTEAFEIP